MSYELVHRRRQIIELGALFVYSLFVSWFVFVTRIGFTEYILLFALPPLVYLLTRLGRYALRTIFEAIFFSLFFVAGADIIAHITGAWVISGSLGYKFFATTYLDNFIWGVLYSGYIIAGYQYFFDRYKTRSLNPKFRHFVIVLFIFNVIFSGGSALALVFNDFGANFFYFSVLVPMMLFTAFVLYGTPHLRHKVLVWALLVFIASVIYDYVAISLEHWTFNTNSYLFMFPFAGHMVPIEEILWLFFAVTVTVCVHEVLVDDDK